MKSNRLKLFFKKKKKQLMPYEHLRTNTSVYSQTTDVCPSRCRAFGSNSATESRNSSNGLSCSLCEGSSYCCWKPTESSGGAQPPTSKVSLSTFLAPLKVRDCGVCCFAPSHKGIGLHVSSFVLKAFILCWWQSHIVHMHACFDNSSVTPVWSVVVRYLRFFFLSWKRVLCLLQQLLPWLFFLEYLNGIKK